MPATLLLPAGALFGAFLAFAPAPPSAPERICGGDDKVKWCITIAPPGSCGGAEEGWHCDDVGLCWCGPVDALTWPGADGSGWPLVAREAMEAGHECATGLHEGRTIGGCRVAGWVCDAAGWCQDSAGRAWWATRDPRS